MASTISRATPSPSHLATSSSPASPPATATKKPTLLICDDEEGPRQSLRIVFKNDYHVLVASSGMEAIALAHTEPIDVAVLDILMQGMSGVELLRELKAIDPGIEVVMLTAYETLDTARQALRHSPAVQPAGGFARGRLRGGSASIRYEPALTVAEHWPRCASVRLAGHRNAMPIRPRRAVPQSACATDVRRRQ